MADRQSPATLNRRKFFQKSILAGGGVFLASSAFARGSEPTEFSISGEKPIIKRRLGKTGIELPIVSFGVMRADNPELIRAAMKEGVVLFDTAHSYQRGKNEEMLGEVFAGCPRDSFIIATKIEPESYDKKTGVLGPGVTSKAFLDRLDISLKRLKMETVDILYVHNIMTRDAALFPALLEAVTIAKKEGKARHVGLSTHRNEPDVIRAAVESGIYEVVLTAMNFKQDHIEEVKRAAAAAAAAGLGIIAMKTMATGFLDKERTKPVNCTAALKFVLQNEFVASSIPGIVNFDHLKTNLAVNRDLILTAEERADLSLGKLEGGLYCQGCEKCVIDCPKGLPIPEIMRAYMYTYGYRNIEQAHSLLSDLKAPLDSCNSCTNCTARCAKGFNLQERIADMARLERVPAEFIV
jgi:predicted aldo/keto reductase-like oxidoreductase